MNRRGTRVVLIVVALIALSSCGGGSGGGGYQPPVNQVTGVAISPTSITLETGQEQQFTATVRGTGSYDASVRWSVNGVVGGNSAVGSISSTGLFTAPNALPNPSTVTVAATSVEDPTKSASASAKVNPTSATGPGPSLQVDATAAQHPINPYIYGMNYYGMDAASEALAQELRLPVLRWGGDATTRYNWKLDVTNSAADWYFTTTPNNNTGYPDVSEFNSYVEQDRRTQTKTMTTMPTIGWTTKARTTLCGFSVAKYGAQREVNPWVPDCGNGVKPDGSNITGNDPTDTSVAIDPTFAGDWVRYLVGRYGSAANGGVAIYSLDNEPMLWWGTHRDVHPNPTTYDEMRDRTYGYAAAIKEADPTAEVSGPAVYGWPAYFYSTLDWVTGWNTPPDWRYDGNPIDRNAHGSVPFLEWYLQQMQAYEQAHGVRILDYLDVHGYVQPDGLAFQPAGDASNQARRLRSTRSLWDPTYRDEGSINDYVRLAPRMHEWVNNNYPGTKLAITEYNWGAPEDINGALAQADILGIFGREGVDLATLWGPPQSAQPAAFAYRMCRNYDGAGNGFGETSVSAASADQGQLAIYAALRAADGALTLMVINKTYVHLTSTVTLAGFVPTGAAKVYRYSPTNLGTIVAEPDQAVEAAGFSATFPAMSLTLLVIRPAT